MLPEGDDTVLRAVWCCITGEPREFRRESQAESRANPDALYLLMNEDCEDVPQGAREVAGRAQLAEKFGADTRYGGLEVLGNEMELSSV